MLQFKINPSFKSFPRGKYIITDPCYIFDDETWDKLIDDVFYPGDEFKPVRSGVITVEGFDIWYGMTAHGDGCYDVMRNGDALMRDGVVVGSFVVDAGMYAIIPFGFFEKYSKDRELVKDGHAVSLVMSGLVEYEDGDMRCGDISVITS